MPPAESSFFPSWSLFFSWLLSHFQHVFAKSFFIRFFPDIVSGLYFYLHPLFFSPKIVLLYEFNFKSCTVLSSFVLKLEEFSIQAKFVGITVPKPMLRTGKQLGNWWFLEFDSRPKFSELKRNSRVFFGFINVNLNEVFFFWKYLWR